MQPLFVTARTIVSAVGLGNLALEKALENASSGLQPNDFGHARISTWIGRVSAIEAAPLAPHCQAYECRNNRLAELALQQDNFLSAVEDLKRRIDPMRIGLFIGTGTSGILSTEEAFRDYLRTGALPERFDFPNTVDLYSVTRYVRHRLALRGPAHSVSTACSSSAKVFCDAHRFISAGLCDAAVVGGVDSLCLTTLFGFNALELISAEPCRPFDRERDGISIGEAAGFVILERGPVVADNIALLGFGESSDAHHMSTPRPDGAGAIRAMNAALQRAGMAPEQIDYINLHGTATPNNDLAESSTVAQVFGTNTPCSATKGWTGHTLGATGITEAIIVCISIEHQWIPGTLNCKEIDPQVKICIQQTPREGSVRRAMSNSFGFGGSNCSLILGKPPC